MTRSHVDAERALLMTGATADGAGAIAQQVGGTHEPPGAVPGAHLPAVQARVPVPRAHVAVLQASVPVQETHVPARTTVRHHSALGVWFALLSAAAFGTSGAMAKSLMSQGWSPAAV